MMALVLLEVSGIVDTASENKGKMYELSLRR